MRLQKRLAIAANGSPKVAPPYLLAPSYHAVRPLFKGSRPSVGRRDYGRIHRLYAFPTAIQHVVVIYMENRTVDDLFSAYYNDAFPTGGTWEQALDLYPPTTTPQTQPTLSPNALGAFFDPDHSHLNGFVTEASGQWVNAKKGCITANHCPPGASLYSYVPKAEQPRMRHSFRILPSPATSCSLMKVQVTPRISTQLQGNQAAYRSPYHTRLRRMLKRKIPVFRLLSQPAITMKLDSAPIGNCFGPSNFLDRTVDVTQPYPGLEPLGFEHAPCAEYPTILDSIVSSMATPAYADWQYIASRAQGIWAAPMAVNHLYNAYVNDSNKAIEPFAVDQDALNFIANVTTKANPTPNPVRPFAALTYITPCIHELDHPVTSGPSDGPQWLAYVVNSIGQSRYWANTTIVVTWDDWGGFFDHYRPSGDPTKPFHPRPNPYSNALDPNEWGFRVPLIVISPYVKSRGYISSSLRSQGAILNYIESTFTLPSLKADDMTNGSDNLSDMFDFSHPALPYVNVPNTFNPTNAVANCGNG